MILQSMPTTLTPSTLLAQAANPNAARPQPPQVVQALLDIERAAKHPRPTLAVEALLGEWRLRFTAPNKPAYKSGEPIGKGFYWPALTPGTIRFSRPTTPSEVAAPSTSDHPIPSPPAPGRPTLGEPTPECLTIENQVQLGPLALRFSGPAKFLAKQNLLAFDFVQLQVLVGRIALLKIPIKGRVGADHFPSTPIAKLPFFAFFAATDQYLAARGRGGGLALWVKT